MALRNAFDELSTETTLKRLAMALDGLSARLSTDNLGALRVNAMSQSQVNAAMYWGGFNVSPIYYSTGAPTSMDAREQQAIQSHINFHNVRTQRWST